MIGFNPKPGYHPWSLGYGIGIFKIAASTTSGKGLYKPKNSETGMTRVGKVKVIRQSCLAMEIRGPVKHSLGKNYSCF